MKKWIIIAVVLLIVLLVAVNLLKRGGKTLEVEMVETGLNDLVETVTASGVLTPKRKVDVSAETIGKITRVAVEEGDMVKSGDLLLEIDPAEYASAVEALEAAVLTMRADLQLATVTAEKAKQDLERAESLFRNDLTSDQQLADARTGALVESARVEAAEARLRQTEANLDKARHDLKKVTIRAPMSGVVTRLNVEEGENAIMGTLNNPGTVLLEIADLSTMETEIKVDETEVVKVALGQPASVEIDAFPDTTFAGVVTEIGNSPIYSSTGLDQQAVDFKVTITLLDRIVGVRPGLSSEAKITVAEREQVVTVPIGAVVVRKWPPLDETASGGQPDAAGEAGNGTPEAPDQAERSELEGVFKVEDGTARFQPVGIGITGEDDFEILSGIESGCLVVSGPFRILRDLEDGDRVERIEKTGKRD